MGYRYVTEDEGVEGGFRVIRDGERSLCFDGVLLGSGTSWRHQGPGQSRWRECGIYRTKLGRYVVAYHGVTCWQNEEDWHRVEVVEDAEGVLRALRGGLDGEDGQLHDEAVIALESAATRDEALIAISVETIE